MNSSLPLDAQSLMEQNSDTDSLLFPSDFPISDGSKNF